MQVLCLKNSKNVLVDYV